MKEIESLIIQPKHIYFILGLCIGYLIGSISTLMILTILGVICWNWKTIGKFISNIPYPTKTRPGVINNRMNHQVDTKKISVWIKAESLAGIEEYCRLQDVTIDSFIVKASTLVFKKDKDWIAYQRALKTSPTKSIG